MEPRMNSLLAMKYVWPGKVIQIIDPQFFWMQFTSREILQQFDRLLKDMQSFAHQDWVSSNMDNIEAGMSVLVNTGSIESPYLKRGQIARIMQNNTVDVFYVDYGNTELTAVDKICTYVPIQFKECPPQAIKCRLVGITPLVNSWTSRGIKTFQKMTSDCIMNVLTLYAEHGCLDVSLYPSDEVNGKSIAHSLVSEEVAMLFDEQPIPEYFQDIPSFIQQGYQNDSSPVNSSPSSHGDDIKTGSSPKVGLTSPSAEKYIPPHQKNHTSASSGIGNLGASPTNNSGSVMKTPNMASSPSNHSTSKSKEPVIDFFPFDNVSVYPPSPNSPLKSPSKMGGNGRPDQPQNGSYFSKSPSRHDQHNPNNGVRKSPAGRYTSHDSYHRQTPQRHHADRHRFATNFDNLPAPVNTFEPDYLNSKPASKPGSGHVNNTSSGFDVTESELKKSTRAPNLSINDTDNRGSPRPRLYIPNANGNQAPFYAPQQQGGDKFKGYPAMRSAANLQFMPLPNQPPGLVPPGFYQTNVPPNLNPPGQYFPQSGLPGHHNGGQSMTSSSPIKVPSHGGYDTRQHPHQYYDQHNYDSSTIGQSYAELNTNQNFQPSPTSARSPGKASTLYTPTKHNHEGPESPESPAIAAFNLSDLEHTQALSVEHFHQHSHQKRLQALQEEADDIATETREQADLVNIARFRSKLQTPEEDDYNIDPWEKPDIHDEIEANNSNSYKEYDELRKSPIKKSTSSPMKVKETSASMKLGEIPTDYVPDISYTDSINEALEYGRTEGMEKAVVFLDHVVELLKKSDIEKQLYDVLMLLLSKAIEEFNLYHVVVMDTIHSLSDEFDIKECLLKVLKRKQELYVRVPAAQQPYHSDFARVMGLICNMAADWTDNKSNIQDGVLATVEKWIVFNRMGTQIGQVDKENIFLDCFIAFWDICGTFLIRSNHSFISRIKDEVRKKLLNEQVARPIRDRLIDILLELFPTNQESIDTSTQTPRCTMIPSSCQVKPSTCDKETWITSDLLDDAYKNKDRDSMLSVDWSAGGYDDESFYSTSAVPTSYKQSPFHSCPSSTMEKNNKYGTSAKSTEDVPIVFNDSNSSEHFQDLVQNSSSEYDSMTNKLAVNDSKIDRAVNDSFSQSDVGVIEQENQFVNVDVDREVEDEAQNLGTSCDSKKKTTAWNGNSSRSDSKTVLEKKGLSGKSIVDWFDYEPPSQGAAKSETKLEEKRLETKKKLDSTSMEIIDSDVASKYAPVKGDRGKKRNKRDKKSVKTESENMRLSNGKENNVYHIQCNKIEELNERSQTVHESKETLPAIGRQINKMVECADDNIDWWGVGETEDVKVIPAGVETYRDNIYVDNGPDVIIEAEFDQNIEGVGTVPGCSSDKDNVIDDKKLSEEKVIQNDEANEPDLSDSSDKEIGQHEILCGNVDDEYAFQLDDDDDDNDNWDSDNSGDIIIDECSGFNKQPEDPKLKDVVPITQSTATSCANINMLSGDCEEQYPAINSNQFVKVNQQEVRPKPSPTRWVPGRRKCLRCHSEDHTTAECNEKYNLL